MKILKIFINKVTSAELQCSTVKCQSSVLHRCHLKIQFLTVTHTHTHTLKHGTQSKSMALKIIKTLGTVNTLQLCDIHTHTVPFTPLHWSGLMRWQQIFSFACLHLSALLQVAGCLLILYWSRLLQKSTVNTLDYKTCFWEDFLKVKNKR